LHCTDSHFKSEKKKQYQVDWTPTWRGVGLSRARFYTSIETAAMIFLATVVMARTNSLFTEPSQNNIRNRAAFVDVIAQCKVLRFVVIVIIVIVVVLQTDDWIITATFKKHMVLLKIKRALTAISLSNATHDKYGAVKCLSLFVHAFFLKIEYTCIWHIYIILLFLIPIR
jgi:hypothetical protein